MYYYYCCCSFCQESMQVSICFDKPTGFKDSLCLDMLSILETHSIAYVVVLDNSSEITDQ